MTWKEQKYFWNNVSNILLTLAQFLIDIFQKVFMKRILQLVFLLTFTLSLQAQKDTINYIGTPPQQDIFRPATAINVTIYPVPVRENNFTIKSDKDISFIKITNIIGQDIFRVKYNNPQQIIRIMLDNPKRGMYIVTINFSDGTRVVKKIMVEESE
jgi:hypothetical protein